MFFMSNNIIALLTAFAAAKIFLPFISDSAVYTEQSIEEIKTCGNFGDFFFNIVPDSVSNLLSVKSLPSLIAAGVVFGFFVTRSHDKSRIFLNNFFKSLTDVTMQITDFVARLSPIGVFCIVLSVTAGKDMLLPIFKLTPFFCAVAVALLLHTFVWLPLSVKILTGCSPYRLLKDFGSVLFSSFAFSSSVLTLPFAIHRMKTEIGVSSRVGYFSMSFGSMINYCGGSIFTYIAALFTASAFGIEMSLIENVLLMFAVSFISFGTAGMPAAGTALLFPVLDAIGLPSEGIGVFALCDIIFSMSCAFVNSWSNICNTVIIAHTEGEQPNVDGPDREEPKTK